MGAFTNVTLVREERITAMRIVTFTAKGPASYDSGGSTIDLSTAALGKDLGFAVAVDGLCPVALSAAASSKYQAVYLPAASNAPATGKIKVNDASQAADAEATGDLSGTTFTFVAFGK